MPGQQVKVVLCYLLGCLHKPRPRTLWITALKLVKFSAQGCIKDHWLLEEIAHVLDLKGPREPLRMPNKRQGFLFDLTIDFDLGNDTDSCLVETDVVSRLEVFTPRSSISEYIPA